jgi:hypothetical protein
MSNLGRTLSFVGALAAVICFFLPWTLTSCGDRVIELSGWQMAVGGTVQTNTGPQEVPDNGLLFIAFLCALATLIVLWIGALRGPGRRGGGIAVIALAVVPLLILLLRFGNQLEQASAADASVEFLAGFWGTVGGYTLAAVGGLISALTAPKRPRVTTAPG